MGTKVATTFAVEIISDDDKHLQEDLNLLVETLVDGDGKQHFAALETLKNLIRMATTSMTNVPKPLKYLRCHYTAMKTVYEKMADGPTRKLCADVISVMSMAAAGDKQTVANRECLKYCLLGSMTNVGGWGHEYLRQLEGELVEEYLVADDDSEIRRRLTPLVHQIAEFDMRHNAEIQACDMLMEIDKLDLLAPLVDAANYARVCLYLTNCAQYLEARETQMILEHAMGYYRQFGEYPRAMCLAMQVNDVPKMHDIFKACTDPMVLKQLAHMLGRQRVLLDISDETPDADNLRAIMSNALVNDYFLNMARELGIMEPKKPEEIFKSWLESMVMRPTFHADVQVDSARHNLASSFVNAFVNAGFSNDNLMTITGGHEWIHKNKEHGMLSTTAGLGLVFLWDVDRGLSHLDRYLYPPNNDYIIAGALLGIGMVNCGVRDEVDPVKALLDVYVANPSIILRTGAIFGLGLAYAGCNREDILDLLLPVFGDPTAGMELMAIAAISCGLIAVGTCNHRVTSTVLQVIMETSKEDLKNTYARFLALALGLCFLGCKQKTEAFRAALEVLTEPFKKMALTMLQMCAYAGTGDVLVIQELLATCSEHHEPTGEADSAADAKKPKKAAKDKRGSMTEVPASGDINEICSAQSVAALGVGLVAMGEDVGADMSTRLFAQLSRYGDQAVRKAVPLAIALKSVSNPQLQVIDVLNKFSHDADFEVSNNAILCMGLVGAGSNNARLATMLRHMAQFHAKNVSQLFMVRLSQGLVHLGKGTISLTPFHTDRQVMSPVALAGLLVTLVSCLDVKNILLGRTHYLLYSLVCAMHPRWLVTLDEDMMQLSVTVRIGQAVDIVGKAGCPKTIAGIHTNNTPVLLAVGERAELANDDYIPLTPIMEGIVILRKKPSREET